MSDRLPRLTAREIIRVLEQRGFSLARSNGSHHIAEGKRVTVPVHAGKTLHPKLLQSIPRDADIEVDKLKN